MIYDPNDKSTFEARSFCSMLMSSSVISPVKSWRVWSHFHLESFHFDSASILYSTNTSLRDESNRMIVILDLIDPLLTPRLKLLTYPCKIWRMNNWNWIIQRGALTDRNGSTKAFSVRVIFRPSVTPFTEIFFYVMFVSPITKIILPHIFTLLIIIW